MLNIQDGWYAQPPAPDEQLWGVVFYADGQVQRVGRNFLLMSEAIAVVESLRAPWLADQRAVPYRP